MKVLLLSHNPLGGSNNMGKTLRGLLAGVEREALCQLYVYPSLPESDACCAYYRVTDRDVLRAFGCRRVRGQRVYPVKPGAGPAGGSLRIYRSRRKHTPLVNLLRDGMWRFSRWYGPELRQWLEEQNPTCLLVAPGQCKFLYDMALRIARDRQIPIVTYLCDDFYFVTGRRGLGRRTMQRLLRGRIRELMSRTTRAIAICDRLSRQYAETFSVPVHTVMTAADRPLAPEARTAARPSALIYMGNIRCGRSRSLVEIGQTLDRMNRRDGTAYRLRIYTGEQDPKVLEPLKALASVELCGFVSGPAFDAVFDAAELMLHTEAFDPESMDVVRYSISTKIADCLAGGVCLVAYGPPEVASMAYLAEHEAAILVESPEGLEAGLRAAFTDGSLRRKTAENGLRLAAQNHDAEKTQAEVRRILAQAEKRGAAHEENHN